MARSRSSSPAWIPQQGRLGSLRARRALGRAAIVSGVLIHFTDEKTYPRIGEGMWWVIQTVTTVGYGDLVPTSTVGRLVAALVMLPGIGFLTVVTAVITSTFIDSARRRGRGTETEALSAKLDQIGARLEAIEAGLQTPGGHGDSLPKSPTWEERDSFRLGDVITYSSPQQWRGRRPGPRRPTTPSQAPPHVHTMENISRAFEWIAVGELILAFAAALAGVVYYLLHGASLLATYHHWRAIFGRGLLVGLEILVAADLIRTVAVEPTLENIGVLGLIVVVRTLLSFSLDIEIDGVLPWRKAELQARDDGG